MKSARHAGGTGLAQSVGNSVRRRIRWGIADRSQTLSARLSHDKAMMSERLKQSLTWRCNMGMIVTGFTLFGMIGLVLLDMALEEPTQVRSIKSKPRARVVHAAAYTQPRKKAA